MISYLADGILMTALVVTCVWVLKMNSRLQKLRDNQFEFRRIMEQTTQALEGIELSIDEINIRGQQVLNALGSRIDEARDIVTDIDQMTREVRKQQKELRLEMITFQEQIGKECSNQIDILKKVSEAANSVSGSRGREDATSGPSAVEPSFHRLEDQLPPMLRKVRLKS
ncbi:hypothetical protein SAMN04515647_2415 [Cohaesibacter sp. ES.047]|uniref:hypothetical protein n=1 Tax=Cohaesibacter sp. ES.047 TaxID=1798205 RepID=UPI000BB84532|nr:hypothetical protein [Cohaesibacter sp. ES.047]SNY92170.1 hypothetical protein SAMN04515647_2415 [Cohaesibacter sp. ES.047]